MTGPTTLDIEQLRAALNLGWSMAELEPWADSKLLFRPSYFDYVGAPVLDWPAVLPRITCPVLLITADPERGSIVTSQQAAALQALVPQVRVAHIAGAGHSIRRDQFEGYMATIRLQFKEWPNG